MKKLVEACCEHTKNIRNLTTDGCTLSPDMNFFDCCKRHDHDYRDPDSCETRLEADKRLRDCIRGNKGWLVAQFYYACVRAFGRNSFKGARKEKLVEEEESDWG